MNKSEFLSKLEKSLKDNHVNDTEDIILEYGEHFRYKLADGFSEEEIAARLGNPEVLAKQFDSAVSVSGKPKANKIIAVVGLCFADIFVAALFILLFSWVLVMGAASIATVSAGVCLIGNINIYSIIPEMPYWCAFLFFVTMISFAVLLSIGALYCYLYAKQLLRAYIRFHKNILSASVGGSVYPPLAKHPQIRDKARRHIRNISLIALTVFVVGFIMGYIVSALSAGSLEFWHVWNWFY